MTDNLRDRIARTMDDIYGGEGPTEFDYRAADAVIEELGLRYEYENGRVLYTYRPQALSGNGNWKYRVCSDLKLYED